eukprot:8954-Heterococcus_DN1.PRE.3
MSVEVCELKVLSAGLSLEAQQPASTHGSSSVTGHDLSAAAPDAVADAQLIIDLTEDDDAKSSSSEPANADHAGVYEVFANASRSEAMVGKPDHTSEEGAAAAGFALAAWQSSSDMRRRFEEQQPGLLAAASAAAHAMRRDLDSSQSRGDHSTSIAARSNSHAASAVVTSVQSQTLMVPPSVHDVKRQPVQQQR